MEIEESCDYKYINEDIDGLLDFLEPTVVEIEARKFAIERLRQIVTSCFPEAALGVYGSFSTGVFLPKSDIDVTILNANHHSRAFYTLAMALRSSGMAAKVQTIPRAKVPLIKVVETTTKYSLDISFNVDTSNTAVVMSKLKLYPSMRQLLLLTKYLLSSYDLHETFTGGIGSYALAMMIVSFLQQTQQSQTESDASDENCTIIRSNNNNDNDSNNNLGRLFLDFLIYFGRQFNYSKNGISVRNNGFIFTKASKGWFDPRRPFSLCIEDPNLPTNDIGRNTFQIIKIRDAFNDVAAALEKGERLCDLIPFDSNTILLRENLSKLQSKELNYHKFGWRKSSSSFTKHLSRNNSLALSYADDMESDFIKSIHDLPYSTQDFKIGKRFVSKRNLWEIDQAIMNNSIIIINGNRLNLTDNRSSNNNVTNSSNNNMEREEDEATIAAATKKNNARNRQNQNQNDNNHNHNHRNQAKKKKKRMRIESSLPSDSEKIFLEIPAPEPPRSLPVFPLPISHSPSSSPSNNLQRQQSRSSTSSLTPTASILQGIC